MNYYNDNDPKSCAWLRALILEGEIPFGHVDERSVVDVRGEDLRGYTQCHFFAGIGGWPLALRLAGWPEDRPVWTGSCPCQPFSAAGKRIGVHDSRHLWPEFRRIIREHGNVPIVFGEQVASKDGRVWLSGVRADLEGMGYAVGAADLCAAGVGAPHIRQRLYWVGNAARDDKRWNSMPASDRTREPSGISGFDGRMAQSTGEQRKQRSREIGGDASSTDFDASGAGKPIGMADGIISGLEGYARNGDDGDQSGWIGAEADGSTSSRGDDRRLADAEPQRNGCGERGEIWRTESSNGCGNCGMADADGGNCVDRELQRSGEHGQRAQDLHAGRWNGDTLWHLCTDGKYRRIPSESSLFPLAHGVPGRVGLLRGAGNAIVPQVAAEFIGAVMDVALLS